LVAFKYANLGGDIGLAPGSRHILAQHLTDLMSASAQLSEQLTSQHFSHIDFDLRAVSA
jgi:hypothetical protein